MEDQKREAHDPERFAEERYAQARRRMVTRDLAGRGIRDRAVLDAMGSVPRERFVLPHDRDIAYDDRALSIGHGQTISQPYMVALMLELLRLRPEHSVLEVGAGSGYQAAVLSRICRRVYAVEIVGALVERARSVLEELGYDNVRIIHTDGSAGYPPAAPYDRIIVAAGAPAIPEPLAEQLVVGGRLVIPVGDRAVQRCKVAIRSREGLDVVDSIDCVFVPLVGEHGWHGP